MSMCRICLDPEVNKEMAEISNHLKDDAIGFQHVILFCLSIEVSQDSDANTKLCTNCFDSILSFYEFKKLALKNNEYIHGISISTIETHVKTEVPDDVDTFEEYEVLDENILEHEGEDGLQFIEGDEELCNTTIKLEVHEQTLATVKRGRPKKDLSKKICGECGDRVADLEEHLLTHQLGTGDDGLSCKKCSLVFTNTKQMLKHFKLKHTKIVKYPCEKCNKLVVCVNRHMRGVHGVAPAQACPHCEGFGCGDCPEVFITQRRLYNHIRQAHVKKELIENVKVEPIDDPNQSGPRSVDGKKQCDICLKYYANLTTHKKQIHFTSSLKFACASCGRRFLHASLLASHERTHTKERPFICDHCHANFRTKQLLINHIQRIHLKIKNYVCEECNKSFFKKFHLDLHKLSHGSERPHECAQCGDKFKSSYALKAHGAVHRVKSEKRVDNKAVECEKCSESFKNRATLARHRAQWHHPAAVGGKRQCDICLKYYKCVLTHKKVVHESSSLPHVCECGRRFLTAALLRDHARTHTQERPFHCAQCPATFRTSILLRNHVQRIHEKIKNYMCQKCSKSFFKKCHLDVHLLSHSSERPFSCASCGARFKSAYSLRLHGSLHTGERPFACHHCDNTFRDKSLLASHMRVHSSEQPYQCRFCDSRYKRKDYRKDHERKAHFNHIDYKKSALRNHMRSHSAEQPFRCRFCDARYKRKDKRVEHERRAHLSLFYA